MSEVYVHQDEQEERLSLLTAVAPPLAYAGGGDADRNANEIPSEQLFNVSSTNDRLEVALVPSLSVDDLHEMDTVVALSRTTMDDDGVRNAAT